MKHKKKLAFIVAVSKDIAFAAGNIAMALYRYMSIEYEVLVYTQDMLKKDKEILNSIENCRVVDFSFEDGFIDYMMEHLPEGCRFKEPKKLMRFCHYEAFALLEEYQNVIWIDADMSVQADLADMLSYVPFGITSDGPWQVRDQFIKPVEGYEMDIPAVCSGIMLLNDELPYKDIYQWLYGATRKYAGYMKNGDQAIINLMLQEFKLRPNLMPYQEYQCIDIIKEAIDAKVVHFGTDKKIWNTNVKLSCFPEWYRLHKLWIEKGGSDFSREGMYPENIYFNYLNWQGDYIIARRDIEECLTYIHKLQNCQRKKAVLYGVGDNFRRYNTKVRALYDVVAIVDGSKKKIGKKVGDYVVKSIDELKEITYDELIITPIEYKGILLDLEKVGIDMNKVRILSEISENWEFATLGVESEYECEGFDIWYR